MERRNRLLVIVDQGDERHEALQRARWLAGLLEAPVDLRVYYQAVPGLGEQFIDSRVLEMAVEQMQREKVEFLEELAQPLRAEGLTVTTEAVAGSPLPECILADVIRLQPRMVLKSADHHVPLSRTLFSETDWQLMRTCPAPVLMVRAEHAMPERPVIVAAVDPLHEHDKPAALDESILATAGELAGLTGARLEVVHCYDVTPLVTGMSASPMLPAPLQTEEMAESLQAHHRRALEELVAGHGVPAGAIHLLEGAPRWRLPEFCAEAGADIVVMGAVSRSALKRVFIGGLAEKVLDRLPCDLLIVKPADFSCPEMDEVKEMQEGLQARSD
jgi:universal stress protein E